MMLGSDTLTQADRYHKETHVCVAADVNLLKVPNTLTDKKVVLLSDILPTAWHANELGGVGKGDRVAIWGAGPGESSLSSCRTLHSEQSICIVTESVPDTSAPIMHSDIGI